MLVMCRFLNCKNSGLFPLKAYGNTFQCYFVFDLFLMAHMWFVLTAGLVQMMCGSRCWTKSWSMYMTRASSSNIHPCSPKWGPFFLTGSWRLVFHNFLYFMMIYFINHQHCLYTADFMVYKYALLRSARCTRSTGRHFTWLRTSLIATCWLRMTSARISYSSLA